MAKKCQDKDQYRNGLPVVTYLGKRHHNTTAILRTLGAHLGYYNLESLDSLINILIYNKILID